MPDAAVAGSLVVLHRNGDTAATDFTDNKGQRWRIHLARGDDGYWRVTEIEDVEQLLQKLQHNRRWARPSPLRRFERCQGYRALSLNIFPPRISSPSARTYRRMRLWSHVSAP